MFTHFQRFFTPLETNPKANVIHPRNPPEKSFTTVGSASSLLLRIPNFSYVTLAPQFPAETPKPDNYPIILLPLIGTLTPFTPNSEP